jgi:hypothetical protein
MSREGENRNKTLVGTRISRIFFFLLLVISNFRVHTLKVIHNALLHILSGLACGGIDHRIDAAQVTKTSLFTKRSVYGAFTRPGVVQKHMVLNDLAHDQFDLCVQCVAG